MRRMVAGPAQSSHVLHVIRPAGINRCDMVDHKSIRRFTPGTLLAVSAEYRFSLLRLRLLHYVAKHGRPPHPELNLE